MEMAMMIQLLMLASFFYSILMLFKLTRKSTPNLPPGPPKVPLIGNLHNLISGVPHRAMHDLALKYGPLMHLQLGELSTVIVSSPDAARLVLKTHDLNFASRPTILAAEIMDYGGAAGIIFGPYGDTWRQLRKICSSELLSNKRVQSFRPVREQVFSDLARWIASNEGLPINLTDKLYASTYDVVSVAALGHTRKGKGQLVDAIKEVGEVSAGLNIADLYPSIKLLRKITGLEKQLMKLHKVSDELAEDIIHEHKAAAGERRIADHGKEEKEDLVDVLLRLQDDPLQFPLTNDNIKNVILDVLAAGSETSATAMDWAMAEMLRTPHVLEKAQDEVRQAFDKKGVVDESDIKELHYFNSIIKETLRLHPPAPLLLPRVCIQACELNGYEIPVNTRVLVNAWAIGRDPKYWKNPECFMPERFLEATVDFKGNHFEYIPFGAGRRICPGITSGLANVELPLAMFLYHFDWSLPSSVKREEIDMRERFGVTARRKKPLCAIPIIKRPLQL